MDFQDIITLVLGALALFGAKQYLGKQSAIGSRQNKLDRLKLEESRKIEAQKKRDNERSINDIADNVDEHLDS